MLDLIAIVLLVPPLLGAWAFATRRSDGDVLLGFGWALLAWNLWAVAVSELLSLGDGHLDRTTVAAAWLVPSLAAAAWMARELRRGQLRPTSPRHALRAASRLERGAVAVIAVTGALTLATGLISAPNNWDSMSYHLTRVARWVDLGQVAHYATIVDPQLYQPPGAELGILQWYALAGGDRFAFFGQWLAWLAVVLLAHRAAALLGAGRTATWCAALLAATLPMAVLQASSTQNDLTLAAWLLLAATFTLRVAVRPAHARTDVALLLGAALALGLAVLTKGTGAMLGAPVGAFVAIAAARRFGLRRSAALAACGIVLAVLVNAGAWMRNVDTYGEVFATGVHGDSYRVAHPTPGTLASNLLRNATNHLDLPLDAWNDGVRRATERLVEAVGEDPNDPATTFAGQPFRVGPYGPHEDHAGAIWLLLLAPVVAALAVRRRIRRDAGSGMQLAWLGVVAAQVVLFCLLVTWQNWHARLHLPILVLAVPLTAAVLDIPRMRRLLLAAACIAVALAPVALLGNVTRPLVGADSILTHDRTTTMFQPRPQLQAPYVEVVGRIRDAGIERAGIVGAIDEWQYPFMSLGARRTPHVAFEDVTPRVDAGSRDLPDAVVCLTCTDAQRLTLTRAGLASAAIDAAGMRRGRGDDQLSVELWVNAAR